MDDRRLRIVLALVVALAVALRLWHIATDLPDFLEEAAPFRTALAMWNFTGGPSGWNPHSFVYPSLTIYLHLLVQKLGYWVGGVGGAGGSPADWRVLYSIDPSSVVLPARLVHVACDATTVALTGVIAGRLRRGAGLPAALLAAFSPTLLGTSRLIYTDTVMTTLAVAALERMLAWHERGGKGRLAAAVVLIGLAAGAKYPGAVVLVPLAWLLWDRAGARGLALWPVTALGAGAVFLLTTPYALLDFARFWDDLGVHVLHVAGGHLGQSTAGAPASYLGRLLLDLGPAGLALLAVSVAFLAVRAPGRSRSLAVWLFLMAFLSPIAAARYAAGNYLVPVIPAAAALVAVAALEVARRAAPPWRQALAAGLLAVLLAPVVVAGTRAAATGAGHTQVEARRWLEARLAPRELLLTEAWGPHLPSLNERLEVESSLFFAAASSDVRLRYESRDWFHAVALPLTVAGRIANRLTAADGTRSEVQVFPSALDLNRIAYDPRLFAMADFVVTSGAVRGRFEADPARFADECRLYRLLDSTAAVEARFEPHGSVAGPVLTVYRIGSRAHAALAATGPLPPVWWAEKIPESYRRTASELLGVPGEGGARLRADGSAPLWMRSLARVYHDGLQSFAADLATNLVDLDRCDAAQSLVEGTLLVSPRDPAMTLLYEGCTSRAAAAAETAP
jgi:hypothetical protein